MTLRQLADTIADAVLDAFHADHPPTASAQHQRDVLADAVLTVFAEHELTDTLVRVLEVQERGHLVPKR